ncbi:hypothetical protein EW026_g4090 [Hermanssonia centrifuga]|uniref:Piwi-domain-containing protein n=1 Tax=Hermanssonia centrifuga TaxID=98765 RepID=A0A4S4KI81_9APHY|nr:hypothetical protein EW026_g4090 [Hermanssonia centrifuga]
MSNALVAAFKKEPLTKEMPLRPGWGTVGKPINLRANFFALRLPTKLTIYDYDVSITPKADLRGPRKARILELFEGSPLCAPHLGYIAHDRSERLVSSKMLPQPFSVELPFSEQGAPPPGPNAPVYTVELKFVRALTPSEMNQYLDGQPSHRNHDTLPLISALNLVLQKHASQTGVRVGKNRYFFPSTERYPLALGLEACRGFFLSVRPTYKQLMVNVNVCMTAFYLPGNLAQAMLAFRDASGGMPNQFSDRLKVVTSHLGYPRKQTLKRVMTATARKTQFKCEEMGGMVSVERFFKEKYNITLKYADTLPVVNVGGKDRDVFLPAEVCEIPPGQAYGGKLSVEATASMIKVACNPPAFNANAIVYDGLPLLGLQDGNPTLANFGLSVSPEMAVVPARILPPPQIVYKSGKPNVRDGSWNILDVKFHAAGRMDNWAVLVVQDGRRGEFRGANDPELISFLQTFSKKCQTSGMSVGQGPPRIIVTDRLPQNAPGRQDAITTIANALKASLNPKQKPSFVLVLLSGVDNFIYPGIKRLCDMQLGIHTVCMLLNKARVDPKKQDQYFSNVALKVNTKLGGINHSLDPQSMRWLTEKKTMFVGIDVTHPSPTSMKGAPSIAALVASADDKFAQFPASLRLQTNRNVMKDAEEMTQELTAMLVERLTAYRKNVKALPERVIVYRDGVSEGQYDLVIQRELPQILKAFEKFNTEAQAGKYRPTLSIIVCGKRHHARFPATSLDHASKNGNTLPGTVVDQGITDVYNHDFYLQAHNGLQGSVRPTHYTIVYDENKLSADTIQTGIHNTSYLYARATKAVSLVPPAYYADLACERARCYLGALLDADDARSISSKGKSKSDQEAERKQVYDQAVKMWGTGVHDDLKDSMFYI